MTELESRITSWISNVIPYQFSSVAQSDSLWPHALHHPRLPYPSPTPRAYSNSRLSRQWCHPTISSSVIPFSSHLQSFPASGSFPMSWFFVSGGQSIRVSASASVLPIDRFKFMGIVTILFTLEFLISYIEWGLWPLTTIQRLFARIQAMIFCDFFPGVCDVTWFWLSVQIKCPMVFLLLFYSNEVFFPAIIFEMPQYFIISIYCLSKGSKIPGFFSIPWQPG